MSVNIQILEGQVDSLIKLVLVEERKKQILLEDTAWERTPPGKPKDPIGYWKILFDQLKKGGIGVKWEVINDPVKSTFMYWGMWVIWKDINKGIVWQDPKTKKTYKFKWDGGKYKGQSAENINLIYDTTKFSLLDYSKSRPETIISYLNKVSGRDSVWIDLGQKLNSYKPKTATYFEGKDSHVVVYPGAKPEDKKQLEFKKDGTIWFTNKAGSVQKNGAKWDKKSIKDGKLAGGWLINNLGKKVSLGDALSDPNFNFGVLEKKISEDTIGEKGVVLYLSHDGKKFYEDIKVKCNLPSIVHFKSFRFDSRPYFCMLNNNPPPKLIAYALKESKGIVLDDESYVEEAFLSIKTKSRYEQVKYYLGQDPYEYVANFMDTNIKYHKQPVFKTYSEIVQGTGTNKEIKSELCPVAKFTPLKPSGTNSHNPNPRDLVELINNEFFKNRDLYRVPSDFGWKTNNNIYPYPKLYKPEEIKSCELKYQNDLKVGSDTYGSELRSYLTDVEGGKNPSTLKNSFKNTNKQGASTNKIKENVENMKVFNYLLTEQQRLIPKYCANPWSKKITYYPKSKLDQNKYGKVALHRLRAEGFSESVTETIKINYADLCQDFGGLWVYGSNTDEFQCFCRDATHPALTLNNFEPKQKSGYVATDLTTGEQTKISLFDDNLKQRNWSHDDSKILLLDIVKSLTAVFLPGMLALVISSGISLGLAIKYYNDGKYFLCGIEIVFAILSALGKIPGVKDDIRLQLMNALRSIRRKEIITPKMMRALVYVLGYESLGSDAMKKELIKKYGEKAVKNYGLQQILLNFGKEMEKVFAKNLGVDKKGLSKMAYDL